MERLVLRGLMSKQLHGLLLAKLGGSISKKTLFVAGMVAFAWAQSPALAQHPVGHPGVGGHVGGGVRIGAPPRAPIPQPRVGRPRLTGPHFVGAGHIGRGGFVFRQGPIGGFHRRLFFGRPFFRFGVGFGYNSIWWPTCGPALGWVWGGGFDCNPVPYYGYTYGFENYVAPQVYEYPVYLYGGDERDLIWLYLKDGTVYGVTDYWLVNGQMHFRTVEDDPTGPADHAFPYDQLDVQKTVYVNSHRGFRIVFRDEPWQQYLKDHPDLTPPDQPPPQKN
jgi:hypothetical protein